MFNFLKNFFDTYFFKEEQYAALLLIIISIVLIYFIGSLITPFFVALLIAYLLNGCLLYTSPSPRDKRQSRMPSSA